MQSMDPHFQQAPHASSPWWKPRDLNHFANLPPNDSPACDEGLYGMVSYAGCEGSGGEPSYLLTPPTSVSDGFHHQPRQMPTISTSSSIYPFQRTSTTSPPPFLSPTFHEKVTARPIETQQASHEQQASGGRPQGGPRYRARHSLTITVPKGPTSADSSLPCGIPIPSPISAPSWTSGPSSGEINQFLADMSGILGPETMASLSPPSQHSYPSSPFTPHEAGTPQFTSGVYSSIYDNVSLFSSSPSPPYAQTAYPYYPRSAPAHRTTFDESIFHPLSSSSSTSYPIFNLPLQPPRCTTPPSPDLSLRHRRGSSLDTELRGSSSHAASSSYPSHLISPVVRTRATPYSVPRKPVPTPRPAGPPKGGGFSFINYGPGDANELLNGVAPSGSSKRGREEAEELEREKLRARRRV